jgi:hypothetical protein
MNRIEILTGFLKQDPNDSFSRYAPCARIREGGPDRRCAAGDSKRSWRTIRATSQRTFQLAGFYRTLGLKHEAEKDVQGGNYRGNKSRRCAYAKVNWKAHSKVCLTE